MEKIGTGNRRKAAGGAALAALIVLSGCAKHEYPRMARDSALDTDQEAQAKSAGTSMAASMPVNTPAAPAMSGKSAGGNAKEGGVLTLASLTDSQPDRYLIKNATVSVEASDVRKVAEQLIAFARMTHGYVSDSHETMDALGARSITMQLRVPADQFEASMQQVEALGKILDKQVNTEDVTEEFVDSQARLRNLKSTELRLLDHLSKTGKLSDTLLIEKEVTRVRQEIEQIEGRLKFLAHRIAYSTFSITVHETPKAQAIVPAQTFSSGKVASDAARSVIDFGQNLWSFVIWIGIWGIVWLPITLLVRVMLSQRRRKTMPPPFPRNEVP